MKIAHFISTSGLYGAERWVLALLNHLPRSQTVILSSTSDDHSILEEARKLGITTRRLSVKGNFHIPSFISSLRAAIREEHIGILHTHGYKSDVLGLIAARLTGIRVLSTPHGWEEGKDLKIRSYQLLDQLLLSVFDRVVPLSEDLVNSLKYVPACKIRLIRNFVDLGALPAPLAGDNNLMTYIGQLIGRKRICDIIDALALCKNKNLRLQVIGDGPERENLQNQAAQQKLKDRIDFTGFRKDRLELLNKSGTFILPSVLEGIPRAMMEAMALEKTVIGTDIPGTANLITHRKTGLLVPVKSPKALSEAMDYASEERAECHALGLAARSLIEEHYSAARAAAEYTTLYKELAEPSP